MKWIKIVEQLFLMHIWYCSLTKLTLKDEKAHGKGKLPEWRHTIAPRCLSCDQILTLKSSSVSCCCIRGLGYSQQISQGRSSENSRPDLLNKWQKITLPDCINLLITYHCLMYDILKISFLLRLFELLLKESRPSF